MGKGYWAVDLDGTLVDYSEGWRGPNYIGKPVPRMVERIKMWLLQGRDVRIFTARVWPLGLSREYTGLGEGAYARRHHEAAQAYHAIRVLTEELFGKPLPVQHWKDMSAVELWDDRAVQVIPNTGERADGRP